MGLRSSPVSCAMSLGALKPARNGAKKRFKTSQGPDVYRATFYSLIFAVCQVVFSNSEFSSHAVSVRQ